MTTLEANLTTGVTAGFDQVPEALAALRVRALGLVEGFDDERWRSPSRCEEWSVHDVVRHVRDVCRRHVARLLDDDAAGVPPDFDNRETPKKWLEATAGEAPAATVADLRALTASEGPALAARLAAGTDDTIMGPYGPVHWTVMVSHVLWDAWLHDRDVGGTSSTPAEDDAVAMYALLIASVPALFGQYPFALSVDLAAGGGRHLLAVVEPGRVSVSAGPPTGTEDLHGDLGPVVDALAGRGPAVEDVLHGDPAVRQPLTWLRPVMAGF